MQARLNQPALLLPEAMQALQSLAASIENSGLPQRTVELVHMRVSQINGCGVCLYGGAIKLKREGETDERLATIASWRDTPFFSEAERAALALAESVTHLDNHADPVPDAVWNEAARHYDDKQLAALLIAISNINTWNRLNIATKQIAGDWKP
jgi:AhpD family alkylhydroperoxidase